MPFGFVLLVTFAWLSRPTPESMAIGLPIGVIGMLIRGWAAGHLAKNEQLAVSGPFARIRNPLYVGTLIVAAGIVVACRDWALAAIFAAVFLLVYLPVIELEEQHLEKVISGVWRLCRSRVPVASAARLARSGGRLFLETLSEE